jgi:hypothetical protein
VYFNKILRIWVIDPVDSFLLSALIGSFVASHLKKYLSEKKAMERLKNSIIKKSKVLSNRPILNSQKASLNSRTARIRRIYKMMFNTHGGQLENFQVDPQFSNEIFQLEQEIQGFVERLASFLKERELRGVARIFVRNGRLLLELILHNCRINITYSLINEGVNMQVIVLTATVGGAAGFIISWFSTAAALLVPPLVTSTLVIRSLLQQIVNQRDYSKFQKMMNQMLDNDDLKQTIRAFFMEGEVPTITPLEMKPFDWDKNSVPQFHSDQTFEEFIKARMEEELGLVENPTQEQLEELIHRRNSHRKPKGKTVRFQDFLDEIADLSDSDTSIGLDTIIDAEIVKEPIRVKARNEEL